MIWVQAKLKKEHMEQVAWIEKKKGLKVGSKVELKKTKEFWQVLSLGNEMTSEQMLAKRKGNKLFGMSILSSKYNGMVCY